MKDLPAFATENGVASIVLREIPYSQTAYVIVRDTLEPEMFIEECGGFCRAAGAERVYGSGHEALRQYPYYTAVWKMERKLAGVPQYNAVCVPVRQATIQQWSDIYKQKMARVPNAAYLGRDKEQMILENGYFVYEENVLLGIGMASDGQIDAVASVVPGGGEKIVSALCHRLDREKITLQVASENKKAVALYEALGFQKTEEISCWYQIK